MADKLGELFVKISADTKGLQTGLKSAETRMGGFKNSIIKHHKAIGTAMVAMGGAIIAMGVKSVQTYAKMGDEVAKMAKRTGFSTESLSELRHAAEISGTELSSLEKGVKRMAKTIIDASEGMATYIRAFDRIGISAEELMTLAPEEQFERITMAIAALEDPTLRAATAQDIFGRAGTQLLPMLAEGADGIKRLREEAHELGIVFDKEAALKAEEFTDAMTRLKTSIKGVQIGIAEGLMPVMQPLIDDITEATKSVGAWVKENQKLSEVVMKGGVLMVGLGGLMLILPTLIKTVGGLAGIFKVLGWAVVAAGAAFSALFVGLGMVGYGIIKLKEFQKVEEATIALNKALGESISKYGDQVTIGAYKTEEMREKVGKMNDAVARAAKEYINIREEVGFLTLKEIAYIENLKENIKWWEKQKEVMAAVDLRWDLVTESIERARKALEDQGNTIEENIAIMKRYMAISGAVPAWGAFSGGITEWARDFAKLIAREGIRYEVGAAEMGALAPYLTPFQAGGIVTKPTAILAGEKGAEAIIPLGAGGMGNVIINFTEPVFMDREDTMNKFVSKISKSLDRSYRLRFGTAYGG